MRSRVGASKTHDASREPLLEQNIRRNGLEAVSIPFESTLTQPRSQYVGYVPPFPICKEQVAVRELRAAKLEETPDTADQSSEGDDFDEFELTDFAMYLRGNSKRLPELRGLQDFASKNGCSSMLFDGILRAGSQCRYVQGVPFETCSIGNYGKESDSHTVGGELWIQSSLNRKSNLFYRLKTPSQEYKRFHSHFLWLADLAKHFFDYCEACGEDLRPVSVHNFRTDFSNWLLNAHGDSIAFKGWYQKYTHNDFRQAISANIDFLFKEMIGVDSRLRKLPIWKELLQKDFIPEQRIEQQQTIVTPYIFDCFSHLRFGEFLKAVEPSTKPQRQQMNQVDSFHLTATNASRLVIEIPIRKRSHNGKLSLRSPDRLPETYMAVRDLENERQKKIKAIRIGDVISVPTDKEGSLWKDEISRWKVSDHCWYIYVQAVYKSNNNERSFGGIWLYKPADTSCAKMKYPYHNELFLSNNCTCKAGRIREHTVLDVVPVTWHGQPSESSKAFFIRQTYLDNERFVTLENAHKQCKHSPSKKGSGVSSALPYQVGQTVLVAQTALSPPRRKSKYDLDPFEIVRYEISDSKQYAILRKLLRRNEINRRKVYKPNELVYSDEMVKVEMRKIERTCLVRFYTEEDKTNNNIPAPYDRAGTGNAFFITSKIAGGQPREPVPMDYAPASLIQGFDPFQKPPYEKLKGLDLYCGGGNFGRGLEEGGAVHNKWAIDMDKIPIHTYHANLQQPNVTHLFFGSVNDQLFQALQGNPNNSILIPQPGEVDFISAGSPCQGFSLLNANRDNGKGLRNQSMVASVAAYIDFYRPKYGLLENVLNMAQKGKERDHDVLSQLICAIVGMGYQLSTFIIDAWSYGSPQSRSRVFVAFTAPGFEPITHPEQSHSHPPNIGERGLGLMANGQAFGERRHEPTPFKYITAGEAISDLPNIGDGSAQTCVSYPDHILYVGVTAIKRQQLAAIPTHPRGMNFWKAWNDGKGVMTQQQRNLFPASINGVGNSSQSVSKGSRAWGRVNPNHLFSTIVVSSSLRDARMGTIVHWDQNRSLTVMESRRIQSFPDDEVIVGTPHQQMKIIGNSVDRCVALALGLLLRETWEKNHRKFGKKNVKGSNDISLTPQLRFNRTIRDSYDLDNDLLDTNVEEPNDTSVKPQLRSSRAIRDAYESDDDFLDTKRSHLQGSTLLEPISTRQTKTLRSIETPSPSSNASDRSSLKRPYAVIVPTTSQPAKGLKAAKHSKNSSPAKRQVEVNISTTGWKLSRPQQSINSQVNALHLSEKLRVVLAQNLADRENLSVTEDEELTGETNFEGFPTSDEDESGGYETRGSERASLGEPILTPTKSSSQNQPRLINTANRGTGKSPTKAKPINQFYIDLTSDSKTALARNPLHQPSTLPVRPAVVVPQTYVPAGNPFAAYAQTYRCKGMDQNRKNGPKR